MKADCDYKVYQGNRYINSALPIIIVTANTMNVNEPITEHFIITAHPTFNFQSATHCWSVDENTGLSFDHFSAVFTIENLILTELGYAKPAFEYGLYNLDKNLHRAVFNDQIPMDFSEIQNPITLFVQLALRQSFSDELTRVFKMTANPKLRNFKAEYTKLPSLRMEERPPQEEG